MIDQFMSCEDYQSIYALQGALLRLKQYYSGQRRLENGQRLSEVMGEAHMRGFSLLLKASYGVNMDSQVTVIDAKRLGQRLKNKGLRWEDGIRDFQETVCNYAAELAMAEHQVPAADFGERMEDMACECASHGTLQQMGARR